MKKSLNNRPKSKRRQGKRKVTEKPSYKDQYLHLENSDTEDFNLKI